MKKMILPALALAGVLTAFYSHSKEEEKKYTETEFQSLVAKEVDARFEKKMKRVGNGQLVDVSNELLKKEEALNLRELELTKLKEQLEINSKDFTAKVQKFQEEQGKIIGCLDMNDKEKNKRITHMVDSISGMKPAVAAQVLSVQEPDISVRILGLLEATKVSKIFNLMDKEISARLQKQYLDMKK